MAGAKVPEIQLGAFRSIVASVSPEVSACGTFMNTSPAEEPARHSPAISATQKDHAAAAVMFDPGPLISTSRFLPAQANTGRRLRSSTDRLPPVPPAPAVMLPTL